MQEEFSFFVVVVTNISSVSYWNSVKIRSDIQGDKGFVILSKSWLTVKWWKPFNINKKKVNDDSENMTSTTTYNTK